MLDDGTILFLANYIYTYSQYAQTMIFVYFSALTVHLNLASVLQTQTRRLCCSRHSRASLDPPVNAVNDDGFIGG